MTYGGSLALIVSSLTMLIACGSPASNNQARKVGKDAKLDDDSPQSLNDVKFVESPRDGDPATVGCADGQREGFADLTKFPDIAGCLGVWDGEVTLRKGKTSKACGDDLDVCGSPADVCAPGWHLCARDGDYKDLTSRVTWEECSDGAGPGKFVAAISHVLKKKECAPEPGPTTRYPCLDEGYGAEPVCCGELCKSGECKDSVWPGHTEISMGKAQGCAAVTSDRNGGILCCKDTGPSATPTPVPEPILVPPPTGDTGAAPGTTPDPKLEPTGDPKQPPTAEKADEKKPEEKKP